MQGSHKRRFAYFLKNEGVKYGRKQTKNNYMVNTKYNGSIG